MILPLTELNLASLLIVLLLRLQVPLIVSISIVSTIVLEISIFPLTLFKSKLLEERFLKLLLPLTVSTFKLVSLISLTFKALTFF